MRNYKITIAYDGGRYQGWQRQPDIENTIQGILEKTLSGMTGEKILVNGSGRTDGGVHASGQTATFYLGGSAPDGFLGELNQNLPEDIRVKGMELVKNGFHARKSATGKHYEYQVDLNERASVFMRRYSYHWDKDLNIQQMKEAAGQLIGRHDFSAFTDRKEQDKMVRYIEKIQLTMDNNILHMNFYGGGFLYHMVRILAGTLLEVGCGEKSPQEIAEILKSGERANAGFLAPAHGLFLREVFYEREI